MITQTQTNIAEEQSQATLPNFLQSKINDVLRLLTDQTSYRHLLFESLRAETPNQAASREACAELLGISKRAVESYVQDLLVELSNGNDADDDKIAKMAGAFALRAKSDLVAHNVSAVLDCVRMITDAAFEVFNRDYRKMVGNSDWVRWPKRPKLDGYLRYFEPLG